MVFFVKCFVFALIVVTFSACSESSNEGADAIYLNGDIITVDDANPQAEALAVRDGLIAAVGTNQDVLAHQATHTEIIDLAGKTVVPGFIDAHSHFSGVSTQAVVANLLPSPDGSVNSIPELQAALRDYMTSSEIVSRYNVVIGFNYDDSQLEEKRHPTRHELDAVSTELPVVVMHQSGHLGVYNSKALDMMEITGDTASPPGGVIEREADGKTPSGVMQENAHFMLFFNFIPDFTEDDLVSLYKAGEYQYLSNGFTTVQEGKTDAASLEALPKVAAAIGFDIDIISYPDVIALGDSALLHGKLMSSEYTDGFRLGGVKLTFDGSPQGKTAWFTTPYHRVPEGQPDDYSGYAALSDDEAMRWMDLAFANRWQLLVHTNGDAAVDQLIRLLEKQEAIEARDHRTVMIHGQFTRKDHVRDLKRLGVFPALYPMHTFYWGDWHRDSVAGPERAQNISPTGWLREADMRFSIHSDAPVTFPNSMRILDSAVNRTTRTNAVLGAEHRLEPIEALKAMTLWSAYQHFEEVAKGSLAVGKQADMVVLERNPMSVPRSTIKDIRILQTINNGKTVFTAVVE